jgi:hypothetical protein
MLKINSAELYRDVNDEERKIIWIANEKFDKLEFKPNQPPAPIQLIVDYHIDEEVDELIEFRIRIGDEIIKTVSRELKIPYDGKSTDDSRHHIIDNVQFPKPGLYMVDIVLGSDISYSMPITLA